MTAVPPAFSARVEGEGMAVTGLASADLGYRLARPGDERDGGDWVRWRWDDGALTLENDRLGAYPVYYAATAGSVSVSPSIDRLLELGVDPELDLDGLAVFLAIGYYVGADTPFRAIRALLPASTLRWQPGHVSLVSHPPSFRVQEMTREQAVEGVIELVRTAVGRCLPEPDEPYHLPVSGGRDSRHLLLELRRAGRPPSGAVTVAQYPTDWGGDAPYAAALCGAVGVPHQTLQPGPLVAAEVRKNRLTSYGSDEHAWFLPVVDALAGQGGRTFDGLAGGALLHREFVTRAVRQARASGDWDRFAAGLGKKDDRGRPRYATLLSPALAAELTAERAARRIRAALAAELGEDDPYLSFVIRHRTVREVALAPNAMLASVTTAYTPFTDPDLFAFAASIPDALAGARLHSEAIARAFPEVADVPYVPKRRPTPDRAFLRGVARELHRLVTRHSDGRFIARDRLSRRARLSAAVGDDGLAWGRRAALATYLVQLEAVTRGEPLMPPAGGSEGISATAG